jgi:hypothetical protein
MTRRETGEFSLALAIDSDPNSPWSPTTNEVLGFKGVTISATMGELYFVGQGPIVLQGYARLAMNERLWDAVTLRPGDAFAVTEGYATLTVSQFALEFTGTRESLPLLQTKLIGESSTEVDLFQWGAAPDGSVFENSVSFNGSPFDLAATLAYSNDAIFTQIDIDIELFAAVTTGTSNGADTALIYHDFRVDDDGLTVGPESDDTSPGHPLPYPCPILLKEVRLCSYP